MALHRLEERQIRFHVGFFKNKIEIADRLMIVHAENEMDFIHLPYRG